MWYVLCDDCSVLLVVRCLRSVSVVVSGLMVVARCFGVERLCVVVRCLSLLGCLSFVLDWACCLSIVFCRCVLFVVRCALFVVCVTLRCVL